MKSYEDKWQEVIPKKGFSIYYLVRGKNNFEYEFCDQFENNITVNNICSIYLYVWFFHAYFPYMSIWVGTKKSFN